MVLAETFDHSIFRETLARMFTSTEEGHLTMAFNATVEARPDTLDPNSSPGWAACDAGSGPSGR